MLSLADRDDHRAVGHNGNAVVDPELLENHLSAPHATAGGDDDVRACLDVGVNGVANPGGEGRIVVEDRAVDV